MARVDKNPLIQGVSGKIGNQVVIKQYMENPRKLTPSRHGKLTPFGHFKLTP